MSQSVASILERLQVVENGEHPHSIYRSPGESNTFFENERNPLNNADITIIASNIPQQPEENILEISKELINTLNESVDVVAAARLRNRKFGKPALVKISFASVQDKIKILRENKQLKMVEKYKNVFLRGSKTHTERLLELNARTLLNELPHGKDFRITSNGRIVKKTPERPQPEHHNNSDG